MILKGRFRIHNTAYRWVEVQWGEDEHTKETLLRFAFPDGMHGREVRVEDVLDNTAVAAMALERPLGEVELDANTLVWAGVEGEENQLHAFIMAHVPGQRLLAYECLCGLPGTPRFRAWRDETKCETCERKRAAITKGGSA